MTDKKHIHVGALDVVMANAIKTLPMVLEGIPPIEWENEEIIDVNYIDAYEVDGYSDFHRKWKSKIVFTIKYKYNGRVHSLFGRYYKDDEGDIIENIYKNDLSFINTYKPSLFLLKDWCVDIKPDFSDIFTEYDMETITGEDFDYAIKYVKENIISLFETFNKSLERAVHNYSRYDDIIRDTDLLLVFGVNNEDMVKNKETYVEPAFIKLPNIVNPDNIKNGVYLVSFDSPDAIKMEDEFGIKINNICKTLSEGLVSRYEKYVKSRKGFIVKYFNEIFDSLVNVPLQQKIVYCHKVDSRDALPELENQTNKIISYLKSLGEGFKMDPHSEVIFKVNEDGTEHIRYKEHEEFIKNMFTHFTNSFGDLFIKYLETLHNDYFGNYVLGISKKENKEINPNEVILPEIIEQ